MKKTYKRRASKVTSIILHRAKHPGQNSSYRNIFTWFKMTMKPNKTFDSAPLINLIQKKVL